MSNKIEVQQNRHYETVITITTTDGGYYTLKDGEKLIFGVKLNTENSDYDIKKELTVENKSGDGYLLNLSTTDTNISAGKYFYDVAIRNSIGELETIIPYTPFILQNSIVRSDT